MLLSIEEGLIPNVRDLVVPPTWIEPTPEISVVSDWIVIGSVSFTARSASPSRDAHKLPIANVESFSFMLYVPGSADKLSKIL